MVETLYYIVPLLSTPLWVGILKLALVGVFMPQKSTNTTAQGPPVKLLPAARGPGVLRIKIRLILTWSPVHMRVDKQGD